MVKVMDFVETPQVPIVVEKPKIIPKPKSRQVKKPAKPRTPKPKKKVKIVIEFEAKASRMGDDRRLFTIPKAYWKKAKLIKTNKKYLLRVIEMEDEKQ